MVNPYIHKATSRKTKTPNHSSETNQRGDKVASGIVKVILLTKIRRINHSLPNMIRNNLYRELTIRKINYKSTYDLFIWCLYFLDVMQSPQISNIINHVADCIHQRLQQGQTHPNQRYRDSKINQFRRYLASLEILKSGFHKQNVKNAILAIFGTKKTLAFKRIKQIENFDWSIYSRTNNQIVYVKIYSNDVIEPKKVDDLFQNQIMQESDFGQTMGQQRSEIKWLLQSKIQDNIGNIKEQGSEKQASNVDDQFQRIINSGVEEESMFFQRQNSTSEDIWKYLYPGKE